MADTRDDEQQPPQREVMRLFERPIQIRSFIMTAILVILTLYTLYFARFIFIPVALALLPGRPRSPRAWLLGASSPRISAHARSSCSRL